MAIAATRVTVGTVATLLGSAENDATANSTVIVRNRGAASVFVGPPGVTVATGYELSAGETSPPLRLAGNERLYGIAAADQPVHVLQTGV